MDHIKLKKSLTYFAIALPLMAIGPIMLTAGNMVKDGTKNYLLMGFGIVILLGAMTVFGLAIATFSKSLFED